MTGVDEILNYQKNPDEDYYGLLGCDESSTVSIGVYYFAKHFKKFMNSTIQVY